jgi:hypothetical protein
MNKIITRIIIPIIGLILAIVLFKYRKTVKTQSISIWTRVYNWLKEAK